MYSPDGLNASPLNPAEAGPVCLSRTLLLTSDGGREDAPWSFPCFRYAPTSQGRGAARALAREGGRLGRPREHPPAPVPDAGKTPAPGSLTRRLPLGVEAQGGLRAVCSRGLAAGRLYRPPTGRRPDVPLPGQASGRAGAAGGQSGDAPPEGTPRSGLSVRRCCAFLCPGLDLVLSTP